MPKPRIKKKHPAKVVMARKEALKWATDHRAVVLESVATNPKGAAVKHIVADCEGHDFTPKMVQAMVWQLRKEGLIGRDDTGVGHFLTAAGLAWLTTGRFDRALPAPHERPKGKKQKPL